MMDWVVAAASAALGNVVVVGKTSTPSGVLCLPDTFGSHLGPLSGIATALRVLDAPIVALAVDQPLVDTLTIEAIAEYGDQDFAAIPVQDGRAQVTCARYPRHWAAPAEDALGRDLSIQDLIKTNDYLRIDEETWRNWGEDGRSWFSIDEPADVVNAEREFRLNLH